jgi:hypothetical protein
VHHPSVFCYARDGRRAAEGNFKFQIFNLTARGEQARLWHGRVLRLQPSNLKFAI